jgi:hypothetical protein
MISTVWIYVDTKRRAPDPGAKYYLSRFGAHDLALQLPFSEMGAPSDRLVRSTPE